MIFYASTLCFLISENLALDKNQLLAAVPQASHQERGLGWGVEGRSSDDFSNVYLSVNHDNIYYYYLLKIIIIILLLIIILLFIKNYSIFQYFLKSQIQSRLWLKSQAHFCFFWGSSQVF